MGLERKKEVLRAGRDRHGGVGVGVEVAFKPEQNSVKGKGNKHKNAVEGD